MIDFLDTSALIKLYIAEEGSERLARRVEDHDQHLGTTIEDPKNKLAP